MDISIESEIRELISEPLFETLSQTIGKYSNELGTLSDSHQTLRNDLTKALDDQSAVLTELIERISRDAAESDERAGARAFSSGRRHQNLTYLKRAECVLRFYPVERCGADGFTLG